MRQLCALFCYLMCLWGSSTALAQPLATLPPSAAPSAGAPVAALNARLLPPTGDVDSIKTVALGQGYAAFSGQLRLTDGDYAGAIWIMDLGLGAWSRVYEARRGVQIVSPVYAGDLLLWAEWHEDQPDAWAIRAYDRAAGQTRLIRQDPYPQSRMAPTLRTDGRRAYWYESDQVYGEEMPQQLLPVTLYACDAQGVVTPLQQLAALNDWLGPYVKEGLYATGNYDPQTQGWSAYVWRLAEDELALELPVTGMALDVQATSDRLLWRQANLQPDDPALMEEDGLHQAMAAGLGGELMLWDRAARETLAVDNGADLTLLTGEGVLYVKDQGALLFYSFALGRALRLTGAGDYLPTLSMQGHTLLALRAIWDGRDMLYRPVLIDLSPLAEGWPPLE